MNRATSMALYAYLKKDVKKCNMNNCYSMKKVEPQIVPFTFSSGFEKRR